ncbi:hypothetical protein [Romboutsia ilealis]|uniref:hypothetical protein n=1 Tax=Romboutsia ilealis TaxID=1115758 RepID=UPI00272AC99E|nr:hypothetical protein [Romboutsia ilealis]
MVKFSVRLLNSIGVILLIMILSYITHLVADLVYVEYKSMLIFIGGGVTSLIGSLTIGNIYKEK